MSWAQDKATALSREWMSRRVEDGVAPLAMLIEHAIREACKHCAATAWESSESDRTAYGSGESPLSRRSYETISRAVDEINKLCDP